MACRMPRGCGGRRSFRKPAVAPLSRFGTTAKSLGSSRCRSKGSSQVLLGELSKRVRNGTRYSQRDWSVANRLPSEAVANPVDGTIRHPTCHAFLAAGAEPLIGEPKRKLQLQRWEVFKVRDGDCEERYRLLVRVGREDAAHQLLGDSRQNGRRGNRRGERQRAGYRPEVSEAHTHSHGSPKSGFGPKPAGDPVGEMTKRRVKDALYSLPLPERRLRSRGVCPPVQPDRPWITIPRQCTELVCRRLAKQPFERSR